MAFFIDAMHHKFIYLWYNQSNYQQSTGLLQLLHFAFVSLAVFQMLLQVRLGS